MPTASTGKGQNQDMPVNVYCKNVDENGFVENGKEKSLLQAIQETEGNLYLIGEGGIGKTTALVHIMNAAYENKTYSDSAQIPLFIELSHAPDTYGRLYEDGHSSFIRRAVYHLIRADRNPRQMTRKMVEEIDDVFNADPETSVQPVTDLFTSETSAPEYLLLLDGLNEVSRKEVGEVNCSVVRMLIEEIKLLERCPNVRIILTSRSDEETISGDITRLYLSGIDDNVMLGYMQTCGIDREEVERIHDKKDLMEIMRVPLFLALYTCLHSKENITTGGKS